MSQIGTNACRRKRIDLKDEAELLAACLEGNRQAQRGLYDKYNRLLFVVCMRYADNREEAEDMLQEGFILIFRDLIHFSGQGPLGAWMRKVMVNTALQHLRRKQRQVITTDLDEAQAATDEDPLILQFEGNQARELIRLLQTLPVGYRTVLNLYVLEGYSHKEIAEQLQISVNTSKSQLSRAKEMVRKSLEKTLNT